MADVKIKVGAALDSDIGNVFRPLIDAAKRARTTIAADAKRADADQTKVAIAGIKEQTRAAMAAARDQYREGSRLNREQMKASHQMASDGQKAISDQVKERIRAELRLKLEAIRSASRAEIAAGKEAARANRPAPAPNGGGGGNVVGGVRNYMASHRLVGAAGRGFSSAIHAGTSIAGQLARGAGIDFDFSSSVARNVTRQAALVDLVNSGHIPGAKGANGTKQNVGEIDAEVRGVANANGMAPGKVVEGLKGFTALTGDLETARKVMGDLAQLARATGSEFEDIADAAGNVSSKLGDAPDKAETLQTIMRAIAGQGKLGAVEIKDMAVQMAALAAVAPQFKGSKKDNIIMMGVLAQEARERGGAKSAAQATTAVGSFVNTFSKAARYKQFAAHNIDVAKLSPEQIILKSLSATKGNDVAMGKLFMDVNAKRAVRGFQTIYNDTQGDDKTKIAAVVAEFDRLKEAAIAKGQVEKDAAAALETTASKAQIFQNRLDETALELQGKLLPALSSLQMPILNLASSLGGMVAWAASNPGLTITSAIVASIAKSAMGEVVARAIAAAIGGAGGGGGGGGGAGPGPAAAAAAAAAALLAVGAAVDQGTKLYQETHRDTTFAAGTSEEEKKRLLSQTREEKQAEVGAVFNRGDLKRAGYLTDNSEQAGPIDPRVANAIDPQKLITLNEQQVKYLSGELKVRIVNVDEINERSGDKPPPLSERGVDNPINHISDG